MHSSRDPSPLIPAARAATLPTPSSIIPPTKQHHHHRLHHTHHGHHHRGHSRAATQPQSSGGSLSVYTDSDSLAGSKTGEASGTVVIGGGGGGGKDEDERKAWAVLRGKKMGRMLGDNLQSLTTLSTTTTRQLDYTYYSLLSHSSTISTLLSSLSTLSNTSSNTSSNLSHSLATLVAGHGSQLSSLAKTIESREEQLSELQARLAKSREKVEILGGRLEKVKGWIEGVERGERELGGRVRMRLRVLAGLLVGVVVLAVFLYGWRIYIICGGGGGGGYGRLRAGGDLFSGGLGGRRGDGGDVMRKRWNNMNLGAAERRAIAREKKGVVRIGESISTTPQSDTLTPSRGWRVARGKKVDGDGEGRMRKRWNDMNLGGAAERAMSSSSLSRGKKEGGSSGSTSSATSSRSIQTSVTVTPSVEWQAVAEGDGNDEDPRLRIFDEL